MLKPPQSEGEVWPLWHSLRVVRWIRLRSWFSLRRAESFEVAVWGVCTSSLGMPCAGGVITPRYVSFLSLSEAYKAFWDSWQHAPISSKGSSWIAINSVAESLFSGGHLKQPRGWRLQLSSPFPPSFSAETPLSEPFRVYVQCDWLIPKLGQLQHWGTYRGRVRGIKSGEKQGDRDLEAWAQC